MSVVLNSTWSQEEQDKCSAKKLVQFIAAEGCKRWTAQHPARAWEYRLAMFAITELIQAAGQKELPPDFLLLDVGGAGSPLAWIVADYIGIPMQIIDPEFNGLGVGLPSLTTLGCTYPLPLVGRADFISCISVIEHVEDEDTFLRHMVNLLAPGGVLFLTTDYDPSNSPEDTFMYHWMRKRIYNIDSLYLGDNSVKTRLYNLGLSLFGEYSVDQHAHHGGDLLPPPETIPGLGYSFASLCMRKEV